MCHCQQGQILLITIHPVTKEARPIKIGTHTLKEEDQATYLGVTFDKRLTWKTHILRTEGQARKKLAMMRKLAGTTWGANEQILKTVYEGSVRPVLEYSSTAWSTTAKTNQQSLDKIQKQALRIITHPSHSWSKPPLYNLYNRDDKQRSFFKQRDTSASQIIP